MRGDIVHSIYTTHEGRAEDSHFGTYRTVEEAQAGIEKLLQLYGPEWQANYNNRGYVIRTSTVETDFEIPGRPKPRDKYFAVGTDKENRPGTWDSTVVQVFRRGEEEKAIAEFERNYSLLQTFEPFRQGGRDLALISRNYTQTAVLDLSSGEVIAEESEDSPGNGFCPVGFYVPDWWDVNNDSMIPGHPYWTGDREWPNGRFGFVWGCYWGDDSSWKVQYLDLSGIEKGLITRDERFGYVELATDGYRSACIDPPPNSPGGIASPPPFISVSRYQGETMVRFSVEMQFGLEGKCLEWERKRNLNMD